MRYFIDVEFNGFSGPLISLALAPEDPKAAPFYKSLPCDQPVAWVAERVLPVLGTQPISRSQMVAKLDAYLRSDPKPVFVGDWPEDIAHLALLMVTGPRWRMASPTIRFDLVDLPMFDDEALSKTPHNALSDARALRDYVLAQEQPWPGMQGAAEGEFQDIRAQWLSLALRHRVRREDDLRASHRVRQRFVMVERDAELLADIGELGRIDVPRAPRNLHRAAKRRRRRRKPVRVQQALRTPRSNEALCAAMNLAPSRSGVSFGHSVPKSSASATWSQVRPWM